MYISLTHKTDIDIHILERVRTARFKVAITGAGISKASGLPLLNEKVDGIPLQNFFDGTLFHHDTATFYASYRKILKMFLTATPNPAHEALAHTDTWIITQNIDGLHRVAGSEHVLEVHGNIRELICPRCELVESSELALDREIPRCPDCHSILHPGIVLAGEKVRHASRAADWVGRAQVLVIVGTKLAADPVRQLPEALKDGVPILEINDNAELLLPKLFDKSNSD